MRTYYIALACVCWLLATQTQAQTQTMAIINGELVLVEIQTIEMVTEPQCPDRHCDQYDDDCDGVLDTMCPGLQYDICVAGSIALSYMEAAFTGICFQPEPFLEDELCISPCYGVD